MSPKKRKTELVSFKAEGKLAGFLNKLPNKSAFIRKAIVAQLGMECPLCCGAGVVPKGIHQHYEPLLIDHRGRKCDGCGEVILLPTDLAHVPNEDKPRLDQFFLGGPLYCVSCYGGQPACDDCGMKVQPNLVADHYRKVHRD